MKAVALCLVVFVAVVFGEGCRDNPDVCKLTQCSSGSPMCINHVCTCGSTSSSSCMGRDDCKDACQGHRDYHCVDAKCVCRH